jgi:hypothetical protein
MVSMNVHASKAIRACRYPAKRTRDPGFDAQVAPLKVGGDYIGYLQLATSGRFQAGGDLGNVIVKEVQPGNGVVRLRFLGLLLDTQYPPVFIEFYNPIALRIPYPVTEYDATPLESHGTTQNVREPMAIEDVVP